MIVLGVDVGSRKVAVSLFDTETPGVVETFEKVVPKTTRMHEIYLVSQFLKEIVTSNWPGHVAVEEPLIGRGVRSSLMVTQTAGGLLSVLGEYSIPSTLVPVKTWKKDVIGNGNASKDDVRQWVGDHHAILDSDSQDICDAIAIGAYAVQLTERADVLRAG